MRAGASSPFQGVAESPRESGRACAERGSPPASRLTLPRGALPPLPPARARLTARPTARPRRPGARSAGTTPRRRAGARALSQPQRRPSPPPAPQPARRSLARWPGPSAPGSRTCDGGTRRDNSCASGIPGTPPPEPTSTIGPSKPRTSSTPRSESSRSTPRASSRSRSAVRPGVATTARSQSSSRGDDNEPVGLGALAARLDALEFLQAEVHDLPLDSRHRVELHRSARLQDAFRIPNREGLER